MEILRYFLGKERHLVVAPLFLFFGVQWNRDHHIYLSEPRIILKVRTAPIPQKASNLFLVFVF